MEDLEKQLKEKQAAQQNTPKPKHKALSPYFWIGFATNATGGWATATGRNRQSAQDQAIKLCNTRYGDCKTKLAPIADDKRACFSLIRYSSGEFVRYFSNDIEGLIKNAAELCRGCTLVTSGCNDSE